MFQYMDITGNGLGRILKKNIEKILGKKKFQKFSKSKKKFFSYQKKFFLLEMAWEGF